MNMMRPKVPSVRPKDRLKEWKLFVGDTVEVIGGPRDVGKRGEVVDIVHKINSVLVKDCRLNIKHFKPSPLYPKGGRLQKEMPIHYSQVQVIDPAIE